LEGDERMTKFIGKPKSIDEQFIDWESWVFGFGYGMGELRTLHALKQFMDLCKYQDGGIYLYDHRQLETVLDDTVAWLMINILCHADILDYGTSPRHGWLSKNGVALKQFIESKTDEQLYKLVTSTNEDYIHCGPDYCNCGPDGYVKDQKCKNVFWERDK
jgi:hypothetical protein